MYTARPISILEKIKRFLSKKYRAEKEQRQKEIIKEMITTGENEPVEIWPPLCCGAVRFFESGVQSGVRQKQKR